MKSLNYIYIVLLLPIILGGCSDYLKEYSQNKYHVRSYSDLDELLLGNCYYPVKNSQSLDQSQSMGSFIHFIGDEMEEQNGGLSGQYVRDIKQAAFGQYTWQQRVGVNENNTGFLDENDTWSETYKLINVANSIIASTSSLPRSTASEIQGAQRVEAEAYFLRAAYYFWLVNLYGKPYDSSTSSRDLGVPLKLEETVQDIQYNRNTVEEVYTQILHDLETAERLFMSTEVKKTLYRADLTTVRLLLSRVHLYMQQWQKASSYADQVIAAKPALKNLNSSNEPFLRKESPENIFSMGGNDVFRNMCNSVQSFRVSHDLYDSYADNDLRKHQWYWGMGDFVGYTKTPPSSSSASISGIDYYLYAFFHPNFSTYLAPVSDKFLYRTAEAYLNKAEAEAYLQHDDIARIALNTLLHNRYKTGSTYTAIETGTDLIRRIRNERRLELALEGHRWFDLRRHAVCEVLPESKRIVHNYTFYTSRSSETMQERRQYVLEENDPAYTLPIPQSVIDFNTGMINNERPVRKYTVIPF